MQTTGSTGGFDFGSCINLEEINILNGIESIGMSAFSYCPKLEAVEFPPSLKSLGSSVFDGSNNLRWIELSGTTDYKADGFGRTFRDQELDILHIY